MQRALQIFLLTIVLLGLLVFGISNTEQRTRIFEGEELSLDSFLLHSLFLVGYSIFTGIIYLRFAFVSLKRLFLCAHSSFMNLDSALACSRLREHATHKSMAPACPLMAPTDSESHFVYDPRTGCAESSR